MLCFLQDNGEWIFGLCMVVFAAVQLRVMHNQNRQQIIFQRLKLAQEFNLIYTRFPNSDKECIEIMRWLVEHSTSFRFLLNDEDLKKYWALFDLLLDLRMGKDKKWFKNRKNLHIFYSLSLAVEDALRNAEYDIPRRKPLCSETIAKLLFEDFSEQKK